MLPRVGSSGRLRRRLAEPRDRFAGNARNLDAHLASLLPVVQPADDAVYLFDIGLRT